MGAPAADWDRRRTPATPDSPAILHVAEADMVAGGGGGGGGGTTAYFAASLSATYNISNGNETPVTALSPTANPGPNTDSTNINCNSTGVTWSNGEVTIPISGVYAIQLGTFVYDSSTTKRMVQTASILEKQIAGTGSWFKQTEVGYINYENDAATTTDFTSRHATGDYMGQFNQGDKLRLKVWAYSLFASGTITMNLLNYRGATSYLRGHLIHAT